MQIETAELGLPLVYKNKMCQHEQTGIKSPVFPPCSSFYYCSKYSNSKGRLILFRSMDVRRIFHPYSGSLYIAWQLALHVSCITCIFSQVFVCFLETGRETLMWERNIDQLPLVRTPTWEPGMEPATRHVPWPFALATFCFAARHPTNWATLLRASWFIFWLLIIIIIIAVVMQIVTKIYVVYFVDIFPFGFWISW